MGLLFAEWRREVASTINGEGGSIRIEEENMLSWTTVLLWVPCTRVVDAVRVLVLWQ